MDGGMAKVRARGASTVVCRNTDIIFQGSYARVFSNLIDPTTLKAWACCEALALAKDLHAQKLYVACDANVVIKRINEGDFGQYNSIIREIHEKNKYFEDIVFVHEGWASNSDANNLVRSILSLHSGRYVWLTEPWDVSIINIGLLLSFCWRPSPAQWCSPTTPSLRQWLPPPRPPSSHASYARPCSRARDGIPHPRASRSSSPRSDLA